MKQITCSIIFDKIFFKQPICWEYSGKCTDWDENIDLFLEIMSLESSRGTDYVSSVKYFKYVAQKWFFSPLKPSIKLLK